MSVKFVQIGNIKIGGGAPVSIQSMANTDTRDAAATIKQTNELAELGCEIIRVAVLDIDAAKAIADIKKAITIPLVADIHFDHRLALLAMENGCDALRLNPGNIRDKAKVKEVIEEAKLKSIPIRVGVNGGSLDTSKYKDVTPENMLAAASEHIELMESLGFSDIKVSLKASDVKTTVAANRLFVKKYDYPLHLGVTEAGTLRSSLVKSAMGVGSLLMEGIGDTIRVSITGDPKEEITAAKMILKFSGARPEGGVEIVSCPTCGRTEFDIEEIASELERRTTMITKQVKVAVMGCPVNGPGEAKHADFGIAGRADGKLLYFERGGAPIAMNSENIVDFLIDKINSWGE